MSEDKPIPQAGRSSRLPGEEATPPVAEAAKVEAAQSLSPLEEKVEAVINTWVKGFANTPVSRNTAGWNYFREKLPALRQAIVKEIES